MREVRRLRQEKGWNQAELAFHAKLAPSVISEIETGKRDPSAGTLRKLADALEVDVPDLFERTRALKAQAPLPFDEARDEATEAERREYSYPWPWMADALAKLLDTWDMEVRERLNPAQSRTIMVAALDVQDAVTFNYEGEWEALPDHEKAERRQLAEHLEDLAMRGLAHYKESKQAEEAELNAVERRREEIRRRTRELSA